MKRVSHKPGIVNTLCWFDDSVIDWSSSAKRYYTSGEQSEVLFHYSYPYSFDRAISSDDGVYAFIYCRTGTKGLLLKNGQFLREINRSDYYADQYEYPVCFASLSDGITYLVHCPVEYCRIDLENVETGEIVTNREDRNAADFFHSRLLVSPDNSKLISRGWAWHPYSDVKIFDLELAVKEPCSLDEGMGYHDLSSELACASFIDNERILLASHQRADLFNDEANGSQIVPGSMAIWNIEKNSLSQPVKSACPFDCNLYAINDCLAWDMHDYPKIIDFATGKIVDECREVFSGRQDSSIVADNLQPAITFNSITKQVAIYSNSMIEILTNEL
ncbi:hypothetical protein LZZ85_25265 [Terrimonas sp. NA20]|uniref:Uncharacterized protein n=1 Tax=Terrimonas ginsenosidimutans TaxID=2908004 RepID=A0ABS9KZ72_9BACT|nr:hypothetical protein [Terrimonas ginsenosidimutans]MCG2617635.1 hypothetical protein [Terrimonas ginsenosidimutans]